MLRAAIKNLLGHKLRMFLTGFSIILGVSFIAGTYIFTDSISTTFNGLFSEVYSGVDLTVRPIKEDFGGESQEEISPEIHEEIKNIDGVAVTAPGVNGYAQFIGKDGKPIGGQGPPTLGFEWATEPSLRALNIEEGDGREPTGPGEVVMDRATADIGDFAVGDTVEVLLQGPAEKFKLVGIATFAGSDGLAGATLAAFEITEAQRVLGYSNGFSSIDIKVENSASVEDVRERVNKILPETLETVTGTEQANEQIGELNQNLGFINTALLAFAGVAVFVGSFIIQNTFRIIVTQRSKELALLRAMGATKGQVIRLVIYEAFAVALFASIVGIFAGMLVSSGVRALMNSIGFALPDGPLTVEPRTILVSLGVGVGVTLLSALLPAIKASRVSPVEAMRENEAETGSRKSLFKRGFIGLAVIAIGAGLLIFGLNGDIEKPLYPVGAGVVLMFIGVSIIAPLLSVPLAGLIGWPLEKFRGIPAKLARGNARRTPRRTASTAAALMIGVSLVAFISILATSFKSQITTILAKSFPADITITSKNIGDGGPGTAGFSASVYETAKSLPELTDVTALRYQIEGVKINGQPTFIVGADTQSFNKLLKLNETEGAFEKLENGGVLVNQATVDENGWQVGQKIDIEFAKTGVQSLEIVGTFAESYDSDFLISTETYLANFDNTDITIIVANFTEGIDEAVAKKNVQEALSGYAQLNIQDKGDLFKTAEDQIDQILGLFWALLGFAIIIAVLGITNTLMLSISERTKEIGMLRAIGMTRSQVRRMIRYESIVIALFGALLGVTMGIFFAWAVLRALKAEGFTSFVIPYGQVGLYFVLAIVAGIFAAAWPARKAARMDILKAIYHD